MTHKKKIAGLITLVLLAANTYAWSADYSTMSTIELSHLRGTMQNHSQADQEAFSKEWRLRLEQMTPTERQQYMSQKRPFYSDDSQGGDLDSDQGPDHDKQMENGHTKGNGGKMGSEGNMEHEGGDGNMEHEGGGGMGGHGDMGGGMSH